MPVNLERCRSQLDQLEAELDGWSQASPPGVELWTHKLYALIGEILDPKHALAIRLSGVRWDAGNRSTRQLAAQSGPQLMFNPADRAAFARAKETAKGIIGALRWELERLAEPAEPLASEEAVVAPEASPGESRVFLVHGHAEAMKYEVARFIHEETGEWPVILHEEADRSQTIIEKLERHGSAADFAVVLLTADDEGRIRGTDGMTSRARQNVVFEHGYFIGRLGRERVVALYEEGVELPSDLSGVLYKPLAGNWKMELLRELRAAGIVTTGSVARGRETPARRAGLSEDEHGDASSEGPEAGLGPAFTALWHHTTEGMNATGVMNALQKRLHHPGYGRQPGHEPPSVRFAFLMASAPLGESPSTADLRRAFCNLLNQPPIQSLVSQLAAVPSGVSWRSYGGNGRLTLGAVLGAAGDDENAPIASALLNIHDGQVARSRRHRQSAELVLYVEPRGDTGAPTPPATLERWYDRLVTTLEIPAFFAGFLSSELGLDTYADPPAQAGVCLAAHPTIGELVDTSSLQSVAGSSATSSFPSYLIADPDGREPGEAAVDVLRVWCDYALYVDGYEDALAGLGD